MFSKPSLHYFNATIVVIIWIKNELIWENVRVEGRPDGPHGFSSGSLSV